MTPDSFDLLGLPRQPWLEPADVRAAFQRAARVLHPDASGGDAGAFARLNAAHSELLSPASRLRLLVGEVPIPTVPPDTEFGFRLGSLTRQTDALLAKAGASAQPLARALLAGEIQSTRAAIEALASELESKVAAAEESLRAAKATTDLPALAGEFTFLERWTAQLRDRRVALAAL